MKKVAPMSLSEMKPHLQARKTLFELSSHPALPQIFNILDLIYVDIAQVCKRGQMEPYKRGVDIRYTPENYKKYPDKFDKEFKEYSEEDLKTYKPMVRISVPYEELYGEKWEPHHIEYWGELTFVFFIGKVKDMKHFYDYKNWCRCAGVSAAGGTFEEMIVNIGKKFHKSFGKFPEDYFLTEEEKDNHKKEELFFTKPCKLGSQLIRNKKYKHVNEAELNRRWSKWFATTDYGKKNWGDNLKYILAGKGVQ